MNGSCYDDDDGDDDGGDDDDYYYYYHDIKLENQWLKYSFFSKFISTQLPHKFAMTMLPLTKSHLAKLLSTKI